MHRYDRSRAFTCYSDVRLEGEIPVAESLKVLTMRCGLHEKYQRTI